MELCAIASATAPEMPFGHAWLCWQPVTDELEVPYRGYWPDLAHVPEELLSPGATKKQFAEFFASTSVPGCVAKDYIAQAYTRDQQSTSLTRQSTKTRTIDLQSNQFDVFKTLAIIPMKEDSYPLGWYGLDENDPNQHNCCSWAARTVNEACPEGGSQLKEIKHLSKFIEENL